MKTTEKQLNGYLADLIVEARKVQGLHWYVQDADFFWAHEKLDDLYGEVNELIDEVAELMLMCGLRPISTMGEISSAATIKEIDGDFISASNAFITVVGDYEHLLKEIIAIKEQAEDDKNHLVSIKADGHIETLSKSLWMLRQSKAQ